MSTPAEWKWALDAPARLVTTEKVPDSAWSLVAMPPGWHLTTGPGADGAVSVISRRGSRVTTQRDWAPDSAVRAQRGDSTAHYAVRADVERDRIVVRVNGSQVATFNRADLPVDGALGFRVGR